jgi:hypothetical protein
MNTKQATYYKLCLDMSLDTTESVCIFLGVYHDTKEDIELQSTFTIEQAKQFAERMLQAVALAEKMGTKQV